MTTASVWGNDELKEWEISYLVVHDPDVLACQSVTSRDSC